MRYTLDRASQALLKQVRRETECILIGVIRNQGRVIVLYRAGPRVSAANRVYPGHRSIPEAVDGKRHLGFSFHVKDEKIAGFYRNSVLNIGRRDNCIGIRQMDDIIEALGLRCADDFRGYP